MHGSIQVHLVRRVMTIVAQEQAEEVQKREARRVEARKQQAQAALEHSKLRQLRAHRLSGLKVCDLYGILHDNRKLSELQTSIIIDRPNIFSKCELSSSHGPSVKVHLCEWRRRALLRKEACMGWEPQ